MNRRAFVAGLGSAAAWPVVARGQQARQLPIIGYVAPTNPQVPSRSTSAFLQRLRELGWIEGQTITIEFVGRPDATNDWTRLPLSSSS